MGKNKKRDKQGALRNSLSREDKVDMLYSHLKSICNDEVEHSKEDVKSWFELNTLDTIAFRGRRMSDHLGDCLYNHSFRKQKSGHGNSYALDSSGTFSCIQSALGSHAMGSSEAVGGTDDRMTMNRNCDVDSADSTNCSSLLKVNVQGPAESLSTPMSVLSVGHNSGISSTVPMLTMGNARLLRGRSTGMDTEPSDAARAISNTSSSSSLLPSNMPADESEWNELFGGIQTIEMLFPIPTDADNALLDMKPLRIPTDEKWLETYLCQLGDDGKPPVPVGPHHPCISALHPTRLQHTFIKRPSVSQPE